MKKTLAAILTLVMVLTMLPAGIITSSALTSGDYTYTVTDSKATITDFSGTDANVTIPDTLGGFPVTAIANFAFQGLAGLATLTLCSSISTIGVNLLGNDYNLTGIFVDDNNSSFSSQDGVLFNKTKTTLLLYPLGKTGDYAVPEGVTSIGSQAFYFCKLMTGITISKSVTSINSNAFTHCYGLNQFVVASDNNSFSSPDGVLFNKAVTTLINFPDTKSGKYIVPLSVTAINPYAFDDCKNLTGVEFQSNLTTIGSSAFDSCNGLTDVSIPNNVTTIGANAFSWSANLKNVNLGTGLSAIGNSAFLYCEKLVSAYFFGNAPATMGSNVFSNCAAGFKVYYISGKTGFANSWNVYTTTTFTPAVISFESNGGSAVASINQILNNYAVKPTNPIKDGSIFNGWYTDAGLTNEVPWPYKVTSTVTFYAKWTAASGIIISFDANGGTGGTIIAAIVGDPLIAPTVTRAGHSFTGWSPAVPPTVPAANTTYTAQWVSLEFTYTVSNAKAKVTKYNGLGGNVIISNTLGGFPVVEIGSEAFYNKDTLISVTIPDSVTVIATQSFFDCDGLTDVTVGSGVTTIGDDAFFSNEKLKNINFSNGLISIGAHAFDGNSVLTEVNFPNSLTSIGAGAFCSCHALTQVSIPNSVVSIGEDAFNWCTGLTNVNIGSGLATLGNNAFTNCTILTQIVADSQNMSFSTRDGVLFNKDQTTLICYPYGIEGAYTIPDGVKTIGDYAFFHCKELTSVTFPDSLTKIGIRVFYGCEGITSITLGSKLTAIGLHAFNFCYKLISAYFLGNAPTSEAGTFYSCASGFTIYYLSDKTGFTSPPWDVYPTAVFPPTGQYTITFNSNGGSDVTAITQNYNTAVAKPSDPVKTGYTFGGWYSNSGLTAAVSWPYTLMGNVTFYAKWTINIVTITWNPNGGKWSDGTTGSKTTTTLDCPGVLTKTGWIFISWSPTVPSVMPLMNTTYIAQWRKDSHSLYFNANGGMGSMPACEPDFEGWVSVPACKFTRTGYTFSGWNTAPDGSGTVVEVGTIFLFLPTELTLYAQWTQSSYTVTFNSNGGSAVTAINQEANTDVAKPEDPARTGYLFSGWYTDAGLTNAVEWPYTITGNVTFYAKWAVTTTYKITFNSYGGSSVAAITRNANTAVSKPDDPTKTGYTFKGWCSDSNFTNMVVWPYTLAANVIFYAKWTRNNYTVTFDAQGGTVSPSTRIISYGDSYSPLPTPLKTDFVFMGWYTQPNGLGTRILAGNSMDIGQDHTLYAKWIPVSNITVTFNAMGGSVSPLTKTVTVGLAYGDLPVPTKAGFVFAGWYLSPPSSQSYDYVLSSIKVTNESDHTLYAKWNNPRYNLIFDSNGGSGGVLLNYSIPAGTMVTIKTFPYFSVSLQSPDPSDPIFVPAVMLELPTRSGYMFVGWSMGSFMMPAHDVTVSAIWAPNSSVTITFDTNGGSAIASMTGNAGDPLTAPSDPTRAGYTFTGWAPSIPPSVPNANTIYKALWCKNIYTITFDANGGTGGTENHMQFGEAINAPAVSKTGCFFIGWSQAVPATVGAEDAKFTALWNLFGDIGNDGQISVTDALLALQAASGFITLTETQLLAADTNNSYSVTVVDALKILQFISGLTISL